MGDYSICRDDNSSLFLIELNNRKLKTFGFFHSKSQSRYKMNISIHDEGNPQKLVSKVMDNHVRCLCNLHNNGDYTSICNDSITMIGNKEEMLVIFKVEAHNTDHGDNTKVQ